MKRYQLLAGATLLALLAGGAQAQTPKDTVVMAKQIDDIISLDPAEAFEFSGVEVVANVYDKLIGVDLPTAISSWASSPRAGPSAGRPGLHLQAQAGREIPFRKSVDRE